MVLLTDVMKSQQGLTRDQLANLAQSTTQKLSSGSTSTKTTTTTTPKTTTSTTAPKSITFDQIVAAQGGVATNPQTGAKTYASGYQPATSKPGDTVVNSNSQIIGTYDAKGNLVTTQAVPLAAAPTPTNEPAVVQPALAPTGSILPIEPGAATAETTQKSAQTLAVPAESNSSGGGLKTSSQYPSFNDTLSSIYGSRADLQALYNPDGSPKNPIDPRIAGIPTLQDWAKKYGVNESPELKAALNTPAATLPAGQPALAQPGTTQQDAIHNLLTQYGIDPTILDTKQDPVKYVQDVYSQVYGKLGVASAKTQFDSYNKQLLDLRNKKTDEIAKINDNPWLTEGVRVTQIAKLGDKYDQKEANLLSYLNLSNSMYQNGLQQAQFVTGQAIHLHSDQTQFAEQLVMNSIEQAQKQADSRFQLAQGMPFYKYEGSPLVYDTKTGKPVDAAGYQALGGVGRPGSAYGDVFEIKGQNSQIEQSAVLDLMSKYPDAGIQPSDSLAVAQNKIQNSKIYKEQVRPPIGAGGGGGGLGNISIIDKATDSGVAQLIASRPGDGGYGDAYNAVATKYGTGVANAYDRVFQDVFNKGASVEAAFNNLKVSSQQPQQSDYQIQQNQRITDSVSELMSQVGGTSVGLGAKATYRIPGTSAYYFNAQLQTLKSNIAFGALTQMREASKTGGALGQISDAEERLLSSTLGALDQFQSPDQIRTQLQKISDSINRWNAAVGQNNGGTPQPPQQFQQGSGSNWVQGLVNFFTGG